MVINLFVPCPIFGQSKLNTWVTFRSAATPGTLEDQGITETGHARMGVLVYSPHHRRLESIEYIPPAKAEENYYRQLTSQTAMLI